ncbi:efflux transporter outer membrane subunit [Aquabacterium sp.]|uniref:efflux transporter outer membrane subunit n=1 Tax=Aquabacterium sp. TaxID=1872578 RepID=UPI0024894334|nr:efflux transporter outer membrane subunit [Aquabacterium sp.]MDI1259013.1 efflux transporter outer membrane subunit [Aquabacterium sp.]
MNSLIHLNRRGLAMAPLLAALVLAGCATAPPPPDAKIAVPTAFKEGAPDTAIPVPQGQWKTAEPAEAQARGQWWLAFNDPALNQLQDQAVAASPNLAVAAARVKAARASLNSSQADRLPQIGVTFGTGRQKSSAVDLGLPAGSSAPPVTAWRSGLTASYEVDFFQRVSNSIDAATADAAATEAAYCSVLLALQADVAQTYFQLRTLDAEVALLDRTLGLRNENLQLTEKRYKSGDISEFDTARARTEYNTTLAEARGLKGTRAQVEHALALLLGQAPAAFTAPSAPLTSESAVPAVPAGLPSALLERRPDVAAAQAQMMASTARVGLARSAIFPALSLTANGGYASYELSDLFKWNARTWLVNAVLSMPLFDGGRNKANITRAEASLEESVASYRQTVLAAFGDVEDKLSSLSAVRGQAEALDNAVVSARRSADLADKRYRAGEDSYLTLIDTQRSLLAIERQAVQLRGSWATSTVGLIRALGGSWAPAGTVSAVAGKG